MLRCYVFVLYIILRYRVYNLTRLSINKSIHLVVTFSLTLQVPENFTKTLFSLVASLLEVYMIRVYPKGNIKIKMY